MAKDSYFHFYKETFGEAVECVVQHLREERLHHSEKYREANRRHNDKEIAAMWGKCYSSDFAEVAGRDDIYCSGVTWGDWKEAHFFSNGPALKSSAGAACIRAAVGGGWGVELYVGPRGRNRCFRERGFYRHRVADRVIPCLPMGEYLQPFADRPEYRAKEMAVS